MKALDRRKHYILECLYMGNGEFRRIIRQARMEGPAWFKLEADSFSGLDAFSRVEIDLGVRLPGDYKEFIAGY